MTWYGRRQLMWRCTEGFSSPIVKAPPVYGISREVKRLARRIYQGTLSRRVKARE